MWFPLFLVLSLNSLKMYIHNVMVLRNHISYSVETLSHCLFRITAALFACFWMKGVPFVSILVNGEAFNVLVVLRLISFILAVLARCPGYALLSFR